MHARIADGHGTAGAVAIEPAAIIAGTAHRNFELRLGHHGVFEHSGAHRQFDATDLVVLGLPAGQHAFGVMVLNPAFEETGRHREAHSAFFDRFQIHPGKPARIDIVADFGAQPAANSCPAALIFVRHFLVLDFLERFERTRWIGLANRCQRAVNLVATRLGW